MSKWLLGMVTKHDMYTENGQFVDVLVSTFGCRVTLLSAANFPSKPGGFYSTDTFTDKLIGFLDERQKTPELKEKSFFAYHAYTAPHFPLQAPKDRRDKYRGLYDNGPGVLREARLARLKQLGLISQDVEPHPVANPFHMKDWKEMSPEDKAKSARAMETVSAFIGISSDHASTRRWWR